MFPCDNIAKIKYQEAKRGGQAIKPPRWILSDLFINVSHSVGQCRIAARLDRVARLWCDNATLLTSSSWRYKKVPQKEFEKLRPDALDDLIVLEPIRLLY